MSVNSTLVVLLAAQAQAERRVLEAFRVEGATAPERARTLAELDVPDSTAVRTFVKRGLLREEAGGRLWLDERAVAERSRPNKQALGVLMMVLALFGAIGAVALVFANR